MLNQPTSLQPSVVEPRLLPRPTELAHFSHATSPSRSSGTPHKRVPHRQRTAHTACTRPTRLPRIDLIRHSGSAPQARPQAQPHAAGLRDEGPSTLLGRMEPYPNVPASRTPPHIPKAARAPTCQMRRALSAAHTRTPQIYRMRTNDARNKLRGAEYVGLGASESCLARHQSHTPTCSPVASGHASGRDAQRRRAQKLATTSMIHLLPTEWTAPCLMRRRTAPRGVAGRSAAPCTPRHARAAFHLWSADCLIALIGVAR